MANWTRPKCVTSWHTCTTWTRSIISEWNKYLRQLWIIWNQKVYICRLRLHRGTNKFCYTMDEMDIYNIHGYILVERPNELKCSRKESSASEVGKGDSHARILHWALLFHIFPAVNSKKWYEISYWLILITMSNFGKKLKIWTQISFYVPLVFKI